MAVTDFENKNAGLPVTGGPAVLFFPIVKQCNYLIYIYISAHPDIYIYVEQNFKLRFPFQIMD